MKKYKAKVRICPFCGHHGQELHVEPRDITFTWEDSSRETEHVGLYSVKCKCCGARGPEEYNPRFAVDSWNCFHKNPAHDDDPEWIEFECEYNPELIKEDYRKEML